MALILADERLAAVIESSANISDISGSKYKSVDSPSIAIKIEPAD
jgi:hypothetical protein